MGTQSIITAIDAEIIKLQQARGLLAKGVSIDSIVGMRRAKPKKVAKRVMSPEARARIAAAQKKRWAAVKKAAK